MRQSVALPYLPCVNSLMHAVPGVLMVMLYSTLNNFSSGKSVKRCPPLEALSRKPYFPFLLLVKSVFFLKLIREHAKLPTDNSCHGLLWNTQLCGLLKHAFRWVTFDAHCHHSPEPSGCDAHRKPERRKTSRCSFKHGLSPEWSVRSFQ